VYDSIAELHEAEDIIIECKSQVEKVVILRAKDHATYIMSTRDYPITLAGDLVMGGFGSGSWQQSPDTLHALTWSLPKGDHSVVSWNDINRIEADAPFTMYQVFRDLERKNIRDCEFNIEGFGRVKIEAGPTVLPNVRTYTWPSYPCMQMMEFALSQGQCLLPREHHHSKNCFAPGTTRDFYAG
jgi:hypothetical protein